MTKLGENGDNISPFYILKLFLILPAVVVVWVLQFWDWVRWVSRKGLSQQTWDCSPSKGLLTKFALGWSLATWFQEGSHHFLADKVVHCAFQCVLCQTSASFWGSGISVRAQQRVPDDYIPNKNRGLWVIDFSVRKITHGWLHFRCWGNSRLWVTPGGRERHRKEVCSWHLPVSFPLADSMACPFAIITLAVNITISWVQRPYSESLRVVAVVGLHKTTLTHWNVGTAFLKKKKEEMMGSDNILWSEWLWSYLQC